MEKERNILIDLIKGLAILLVVLGHAVQFNFPRTFDNQPLFRIIYSFHMPLFMLTAGYVAAISFGGTGKQLLAKVRTLLLPFFSWFIFSYFFYWAIHYNTQPHLPDFGKKLTALCNSPTRGLWFLWVLFINYLILYGAQKISNKHAASVLLVAYLVVSMLSAYFTPRAGLNFVGFYLLFFTAGYTLKRYRLDQTKLFRYAGLALLFIFPALVWNWDRSDTIYLNDVIAGSFQPTLLVGFIYNLAVSAAGIMTAFTLCSFLIKLPVYIQKLLLYPSRISLEIYATHFYFVTLISLITCLEINTRIALTFLGILALTLLAQWLIHRNKYTAFLFYGKTKKPKATAI